MSTFLLNTGLVCVAVMALLSGCGDDNEGGNNGSGGGSATTTTSAGPRSEWREYLGSIKIGEAPNYSCIDSYIVADVENQADLRVGKQAVLTQSRRPGAKYQDTLCDQTDTVGVCKLVRSAGTSSVHTEIYFFGEAMKAPGKFKCEEGGGVWTEK